MADASTANQPEGTEILTNDELQALVRTQIDNAVQFVDGDLSPTRARLARYYEGELPDIEAPEGRSQAVVPVVSDAINSMKPGLLKLFFGPERVVEYRPRKPEGVALAQQQTEYMNVVITEDNPGFLVFSSMLEDALVKDFGIIKWYWDEQADTKGVTYEHLFLPQLEALVAEADADPTVDITVESVEPNGFGGLKVALTWVRHTNRARIEAVPPEEFLFNRSARSLETSTFVAHRSRKLKSDLLAMGYAEAELDDAVRSGSDLGENEEALQRKEWDSNYWADDEADNPGGEGGEPLQKIKYVECYLLYDHDGDGVAELRKVCCVGDQYHILHNEPAEDRPFAIFMADPKAHTMQGRGMARRVDRYQAIESVILRGTLDSLNLSINPWQEVVENQVSMKDMLNPELGKIIRVKQPGMINTGKVPFVGADTMPMLEYFTGKVEDATGTSRAAAGLDPDALQSSTHAAVAMTATAKQQTTEFVARNLAETGFKPLMRGLYRLHKAHQTEARIVKLFGSYVPVDPSTWDDVDPDVTVNVALGMGLAEDRIATLTAIGMDQKEILTTLGMDNPVVSLAQYRNTLAKKAELAGWKNAEQFYKAIPPDWQPPPPQPPQPPPPDPVAVQLAQIEAQKVQGTQALEEAKFAHQRDLDLAKVAQDEKQMEYDYNLKRDQMYQDAALAQLKAKSQVDAAQAKADVAEAKAAAVSPEPGV